jgi:protein gp37
MGVKSDGQYWDDGVVLVQGCTPVSAGCEHCWERARLKRFHFQDPDVVTLHHERLKRLAKGPARIIAIWSDLFHPGVTDAFIDETIDAAAGGPNQVLILTKRPERMAWRLNQTGIPENVWPGVTVEDQCHIGRLKWLKRVPSQHLWVSVEPILSPVILNGTVESGWLSWVVVGCETGPGARVSPDTNLSIQATAISAEMDGVPLWVKSVVGMNGRPTASIGHLDWARQERPFGMWQCSALPVVEGRS